MDRSRNEGVQKVTTNDLYHIGTPERLKYIGENWVTNESQEDVHEPGFVDAVNYSPVEQALINNKQYDS